METWMLADLDNMIRDMMGQLRTALEKGWQETKPAHYRALVAALESALRVRYQRQVAEAEAKAKAEAKPAGEIREPEPFTPPRLFWPWRPVPALVPVSRGHT
jgi:hypothetical protein